MSGRGRNRGNRNRQQEQNISSIARRTAASLPADSPILAMFKEAALKLNERQDRHERLVKLSRDITIESKRIIFLLHSGVTIESTARSVVEANDRLQILINGPIKAIGLELENIPPHLHSRAVTAAFQEFVEARTLCSLIENNKLITYDEISKEFCHTITEINEGGEVDERTVATYVPFSDYMLGLSDLTGELMRRAINSVATGDTDACFRSCQVVRELYTGYLGLYGTSREQTRKLNVTRANVAKVEGVVYTLCVRGGESATMPWEERSENGDEE